MASSSAKTEHFEAFFDHLVRCETRLYNATSERLRAEHGIVTSQFEFLRYLRDHPGARVAEIAAAFAAGVGAISKGADRLVARGWAVRRPNPADGRSSLLSLSKAGAELTEAAEATFRECLAELVAATLAQGQIEASATALAALRSALEQGRIGTPAG
jgi:DNA-binding MarR family transcriptional regulator